MAFVNKAQRFTEQKKATENIGPGNYINQGEYKQKLSYAPFHSTEQR